MVSIDILIMCIIGLFIFTSIISDVIGIYSLYVLIFGIPIIIIVLKYSISYRHLKEEELILKIQQMEKKDFIKFCEQLNKSKKNEEYIITPNVYLCLEEKRESFNLNIELPASRFFNKEISEKLVELYPIYASEGYRSYYVYEKEQPKYSFDDIFSWQKEAENLKENLKQMEMLINYIDDKNENLKSYVLEKNYFELCNIESKYKWVLKNSPNASTESYKLYNKKLNDVKNFEVQ